MVSWAWFEASQSIKPWFCCICIIVSSRKHQLHLYSYNCNSQITFKMLQNNQITFLLHLCGCIMALISSTQSTQYPPIVTPNYKANRGCPSGQISRSFCPEVNCQQKHIPLDMCGICRTCPHLEREPCGGPYFMHGVCDPNFICMTASLLPVHSVLAEVMSGVNITGKCRRKILL